jgi:tetratricopeptide (TPR) repeat protein
MAALDQQQRVATANRALEQLRALDFAGTVETLRPLADDSREDNTQASILHNLALAGLRSGKAELMVPIALKAKALREKLQGAGHPLTVETALVAAQVLVSAGQLDEAAPILRAAAVSVLNGAGDGHPFFADALLAEGLRQARLGDGGAAEALARRALYICRQAHEPDDFMTLRHADAQAIPRLWRPRPPAHDGADVTLWRVRLQHTLRRFQPYQLAFEPSGDRPKQWFVFVPKAASTSEALHWLRVVFADVTSCEASAPSDAELLATPFDALWRERVWEPSIAFSLVTGDRSLALEPAPFGLALAAYLALRGTPTEGAPALAAFGLDPAAAQQARQTPEPVLRKALWGMR